MSHSVLKTTSQLTGRAEPGDKTRLTHEEAAEVHACTRLHQRYGIALDACPELMIEHLAMLLAGQSEYRSTNAQRGPHHGNEIHRVWWNGRAFYLSYDPRIKRIVTYLPDCRATRKIQSYDMRKRSKR